MSEAVVLRPMQPGDAARCASVHLRAFPGFFLTFLGGRFLQVLYGAIASDPSGIGFVAESGGAMLGFVAGTDQPDGLYARLLRRRWWSFGWASLGALAKRPAILPRLLRAFSMPRQGLPAASCGTLMSIAVLPEAQGCGVGKLLVQAFLAEAERRGIAHVNLTTDRLNNDSTNRFYEKLGFSLARSYTTPEGRQMNEYLIALRLPGEQGESSAAAA